MHAGHCLKDNSAVQYPLNPSKWESGNTELYVSGKVSVTWLEENYMWSESNGRFRFWKSYFCNSNVPFRGIYISVIQLLLTYHDDIIFNIIQSSPAVSMSLGQVVLYAKIGGMLNAGVIILLAEIAWNSCPAQLELLLQPQSSLTNCQWQCRKRLIWNGHWAKANWSLVTTPYRSKL